MTNVVQMPPREEPPEFIFGPFSENRVMIEGRVIPNLTAHDNGDGTIDLVVDHRFSAPFPKDQAYAAAWLLANAMAVGAGYSCLSSETKERPFAPKGMQIDGTPRR